MSALPPTPFPEQVLTPEQIAKQYSACMDSVNLLNAGKPERMSDADWKDTVSRNVAHLEIMVKKPYMKDQDLAPLQAAIDANKD